LSDFVSIARVNSLNKSLACLPAPRDRAKSFYLGGETIP
jgi:hypothetical protein